MFVDVALAEAHGENWSEQGRRRQRVGIEEFGWHAPHSGTRTRDGVVVVQSPKLGALLIPVSAA
jgi:hypothetical protein